MNTTKTILAAAVTLLFACSDDSTPQADSGPGADAATVDAAVPDAPVSDSIPPDGPLADGPTGTDQKLADTGPAADAAPADTGPVADTGSVADTASTADAAWPDAGPTTGTWATQVGNSDRIGADAAGNTYIAGTFSGTATFGSTTLTATAGKSNVYIAKLDDKGAWLWAKSMATSTSNVTLNDLAVNGSGNCFISGLLDGAATFGSQNITAGGYVASVSTDGVIDWTTHVAGLGPYDRLAGIAADDAGNSYVVGGAWSGTATLGSFTIKMSPFVAKLDTTGTFAWATAGTKNTRYADIAVDTAGNSYLAGYSSGGRDSLVAKVSSSGVFDWTTSGAALYSGSTYSSDPRIGVDATGASYLAGVVAKPYGGTATFGTQSVTITRPEIFVAKLSPAGAFTWVKTSTSTNGNQKLTDIAVDAAGNSHITGAGSYTQISTTSITTANRIYVARLDASGAFTWSVFPPVPTSPPYGSGSGKSIALGGTKTVHVTGLFAGSVTFGSKVLVAPPGHFIATCEAASGAF